MGEQNVDEAADRERLRTFMNALLDDIRALEEMLERGIIESEKRRIGAEQEVFLVDESWQPAPVAMQILDALSDPHFTTELGRFNLELNLDPIEFRGDCLRVLETDLNQRLRQLRVQASRMGAEVLLTGILPTLGMTHLGLDYITPRRRYQALHETIKKMCGGHHQVRIKGTDELILTDKTLMVQASNTSFQIHFQVSPDEFPNLYNISQLVTGPVLAASTNSPLLLGKRLWRETRIALFQQAVDTRQPSSHLREMRPTVRFGDQWLRESVLEIFREDIARFRVLLMSQREENPFECIERGEAPQLYALRVFNSTVYRWNRPCYGLFEGRAHLRIENRALPAGPTVLDEVANAAFFFGLMCGISEQYEDIASVISFDDVKSNFLTAARDGLNSQLHWLGGETLPAQELIGQRLLPLARDGLADRGLNKDDITRYLGVIEKRVWSGQTGSEWLLESLSHMEKQRPRGERLAALTAATLERQNRNLPVSEWEPAQLVEAGGWKPNYLRVEQYMTTDVFTATPEATVEFVANLMDWERIRHIPVEDDRNRLVGLVSYRSVLRFFGHQPENSKTTPMSSIMKRDPITTTPEASTLEAIEIMRREQIGCLPVVKDDRLVGIVTERDFMEVSSQLLEQKLRE